MRLFIITLKLVSFVYHKIDHFYILTSLRTRKLLIQKKKRSRKLNLVPVWVRVEPKKSFYFFHPVMYTCVPFFSKTLSVRILKSKTDC